MFSYTGHQNYWNKMIGDWQKLKPPMRPSGRDLKIFEQFIKKYLKNKKGRVLVLGATPEMRSLAQKFGQEIVVVDLNLDMIHGLTGLVKNIKKQETWLKANWLNMPLKQNYFDLVLGDGVHAQTTMKEINIWWQHIKSVLKINGLFVQRIFGINSNYLPTGQKIFTKILNDIKKEGVNLEKLAALNIVLELLAYDRTKKTVTSFHNRRLYYKYGKNISLNKKQKDEIFRRLIAIYPATEKYWYTITQEESAQEARQYFKILDCEYSPSRYFPKFARVYCLKK